MPPPTALCAASIARSSACPGDEGGPLLTQGAEPLQVGWRQRRHGGTAASSLHAYCVWTAGCPALQATAGSRLTTLLAGDLVQVGIVGFFTWNQICGGAGNWGGYTDVRSMHGWIQATLAAGL